MRYIVICGLHDCTIVSHIISQMAQLNETLPDMKLVFRFSTELLSEIFHVLGRPERGMIEEAHRS